MKKNKVTVKDIALKANVSPGTVSNAFNNREGMITEETRQRIIQIAKEMGYQHTKHSGIIRFVIIVDLVIELEKNSFFSEVLRWIEWELSNNNFLLTISYVDIKDVESGLFSLSNPATCDGIIILGTSINQSTLEKLNVIRVPYIVFDTAFNSQEYDFVCINNIDAAYMMTSHLIDYGHKNIGMILSNYKCNNFRERKVGFIQSMYDHRLKYNPIFDIEILGETIDEAQKEKLKDRVNKLMSSKKGFPTAYFAVNDYDAMNALTLFKEMDLDISVCGFDNVPNAAMFTPAITTIDVDKKELAIMAVDRILNIINRPSQMHRKVMLGTNIIYRDSVKRLNKNEKI